MLKALSLLLCAQSVMSIAAPPDLQSKIITYCLDNIGAPTPSHSQPSRSPRCFSHLSLDSFHPLSSAAGKWR